LVNRLFFKIVPKAKIAQHLKERMMPRRPPHILNIIGTDTFLGSRRTGKIGLTLTQEWVTSPRWRSLSPWRIVNNTVGSSGTNEPLGNG
jgi:hypothetical protein